jgi:hypothetical protein
MINYYLLAREKFNVTNFFYLINQLLIVGYVNFANIGNSELKNLKGLSQGLLLSPLFCNILLDDLDIFIFDLCRNIFVKRVKTNLADWNAGQCFLNTPWEKV